MSVEGQKFCPVCGQSQAEANRELLWDAYRRQGVEREEPYVFSSEEWWGADEEEHELNVLITERNMHRRGLCHGCGLPDARRFKPQEEWLSDEELKDWHDYMAEVAAERRMGC